MACRALPTRFINTCCRWPGSPWTKGRAGSRSILTRQEPVGVTRNGGQWVAQFMGDSTEHLSKRCELLRLQEFRMENALGSQVTVNFHAPQHPPDGIEDGPRRSFKDARSGMHHLKLFAHTTFDSARQFPPARREPRWFRSVSLQPPDQSLQGLEFSGLLRRQSSNLFESRIHGADIILGVEEDDAFFQPFDDALQFDVGLSRRFAGHQWFEQNHFIP